MTYLEAGQTFRYRFYDIMQATFLGDMPLEGVAFGQRLNTPGSFNATLPLSDPRVGINLDAAQATQPGRTLIIVDLDGKIVWGGILWTRQFSRSTRAFTLGGQEATSYFAHRVQAVDHTTTWSTTAADPLVIAKQMIEDCLVVPFSAFHPAAAFAMPVVLNYQEAISPADYITVSYPLTQLQTLDTILQNLSQMGYGTGFDYSIDWTYVSGVPSPTCNLWYPRRGFIAGLTAGTSPNALESHPAYDYTYPEDATTQANKIYVTASQSSGTSDTAVDDPASFTAGYPLLEEVANFTQVNTGAQLSALAEGELATHSQTPTTPVVDVTPFGNFPLGGFLCGDDIRWIVPAQVQIAGPGDERFPGGPAGIPFSTVTASGLDATYRIASWDATIGDEGVSHLALTLSLPPPIKPATPSSLYVPQLLADIQSQIAGLATSGSSGKTYATIVVAASNSRSIAADFVCAGATDEATINLAIAALPSFGVGGKVLLLEGHYNTAAPIVAAGFRNLTLEGMGGSTIINGLSTGTSADDYDLVHITLQSGAIANVARAQFNSKADLVRAGHDIGVIHITPGSGNVSATVADCYLGGFTGGGGAVHGILNDVTTGPDENTNYLVVEGNFFDNAGFRSYGANGAYVAGNEFNGSHGIEFFGRRNNNISIIGNTADGLSDGPFIAVIGGTPSGLSAIQITIADNTGIGIELGPAIYVDSVYGCTITNNSIDTVGSEDDATGWLIPGGGGLKVGGHGVAIRSTFSGTSNVIVHGNDCENAYNGISAVTTGHTIQNLVVTGNGCDNPSAEGIVFDGVTDSTAASNSVSNTTATGILLRNGASSNNIGDNTVRNTVAYAIDISTSDCSANFVHGNDCGASDIHDAGTATIRDGNRYLTVLLDGSGAYAASQAFFLGG